jgi:DNA segregation ATPase FtsK/SpoIIIE, S-DNA-T family
MRARGIGSVVARGRVGLVLGAPTPLDGDLLGVRLPRVRDVRPGRGWWVVDRRAVPAQVGTGAGLSRYGAERPLHPTTTPTSPRTPSVSPVTT